MPAAFLIALLLAAPPAGDAGAKKVCRAAQAPLGSHVKRPRLCRTQAEWRAEEEASRAAPVPLKAPQPESWERTRPQ
ncbi:MAG: hypothetical protein JOZ90_17760 [Alphaproteobacteria bacterium]|nr:hypothetical protein [Alphaproteobacteria bacterium]MBV9373035.1 hypothetical protein [Alphaproteobacteria bacterium]MBV9902918.1 hypothetical protein [Alphaproteobacteria bacterium]